jgi:hypothetical protein
LTPTTLPPERAHAVHLGEQRGVTHQLVGQEHRERPVADRLAGAPDGVPQPPRLVLVGDRHPPVAPDAGEPIGGVVVALVAQHRDQGVVTLEVALDRRFGVIADDDDVLDPGAQRLVDDELDRRRVADRHQLLGDSLRRRQEPRTRSGSRDDRTAHLHRPAP